ncbi:hypothetical protein [Lentzea sp. CA-135723]
MTDGVGTAAGSRVWARVAAAGLVLLSGGLAVFGGCCWAGRSGPG